MLNSFWLYLINHLSPVLSKTLKGSNGYEMFNEQATKEYINTQFLIQEQIEKLQSQLADHNKKATHINWAHVGDMNYILSQLKELNGEEDE
jgi:hypothetical protein